MGASESIAQKLTASSTLENLALFLDYWTNYCDNKPMVVKSEERLQNVLILYFNYNIDSNHVESYVQPSVII